MDKNSVATTNSPWQIENLVISAFRRTKDRFLSYFLATILSWVIGVAAILILLFIGGILFSLVVASGSIPLFSIVIILLVPITVLFFAYFSIWVRLAMVEILIQDEKLGFIETFRKAQPLVPGFLWFAALEFLFVFGLLFFGFFTLFIILILWSFWSSFAVFVYLGKRKKGLENLWYSRSMVNERFWGIAGRLALIGVAIWFVNLLIVGADNNYLRLGYFLVQLFTAPFAISFTYEMYKILPEPSEVKRPVAWIWLSVIGWVITVILLIFTSSTMISLFRSSMFPARGLFYDSINTKGLNPSQDSLRLNRNSFDSIY